MMSASARRARPFRSVLVVALAAVGIGVVQAGAPVGASHDGTITDACTTEVPSAGFVDVAAANVHADAIDCVVAWAVARGTSSDPPRYSPSSLTNRGQMATFLSRLLDVSGHVLPEPAQDHFDDDDGSTHERSINRLADAGLVGGVGAGRFAPGRPVTRAQMASFIVRAYEHRTDQPVVGAEDHFVDDDGNTHEDNIDKAAEAGFTTGRSPGRYEPDGVVRRDAMASFLARMLDALVEGGFAEFGTPPPTPSTDGGPTAPGEQERPSGGGVEGTGTGVAPPPPSGDPASRDNMASVGEQLGFGTLDLPDGPGTMLEVGLAGTEPGLPVMEPGVRATLNHAQPSFQTWEFDFLAYAGLPPAVGRLYASWDGSQWFGVCTATVIGRDQILTAAHCFFDTRSKAARPYFLFYPDLYDGQAQYGGWRGTINSAYVDPHWMTSGQTGFWADYGILKLAPNVSGGRIGDTVGAYTVYTDGDRLGGNRFTIGYPSEGMYSAANRQYSAHGTCSNESCRPHYCWSPVSDARQTYNWESTGYYRSIGFGCYVNGGWSGGPVFHYADDRLHLVGVTSTMGNQVPYACANAFRCIWYGHNLWGPVFRMERFLLVWNAAQ